METFFEWMNDPQLIKIAIAVSLSIVVIFISRILKKTFTRFIHETDTRYRIKKLITFISYFIIIMIFSLVFSRHLGNLTIALGVAGAGIAFALQEVIASIAGWIAIVFGNFFSTGDRVQLGGIKGDVIDIGILRTTMMEVGQWVNGDLYNGRVVKIANSFVFKEPVFNYSGDFPFLWDEIVIPIKYGSDIQFTRLTLQSIVDDCVKDYIPNVQHSWNQMVNKYRLENARLEPLITLIANDNWIEFTIRYIVDFTKRRITKDLLFTKILEAVDKSRGKISFASATFHLVEIPELNINFKKNINQH